MEISRNLSKQLFSTGSGRKTLKNSQRDYCHLLKSPDFRLLVLKCAGSYLRVFTVLKLSYTRPFYNNWNYASTANTDEVMKFYNLGDKTFETDFS